MAIQLTYACGDLAEDVPRWSFSGASHEGITMGEATEVKPFAISAAVYDSVPGMPGSHFAGVVSGSVAHSSGAGAVVGFSFDTRDGSWEAAVAMSFESADLNATLRVQSGSACKEDGTRGSGTVSMKIGESSVVAGTASVLKRCGEFAAAWGLYLVDVAVDKAVIDAGRSATVKLTHIKASIASSPAVTHPSASFTDLVWVGTVGGVAELLLADAGGAQLVSSMRLTAAMTYTVNKGAFSLGSLNVAGRFEHSDGALQMSGDVTLTVPCEAGQPMVAGEVSFDVLGGGAVTVIGGRGTFSYACGGGLISLDASADGIWIAGAVQLTDAKAAVVFKGASLSAFTAHASGTVDVSTAGFVPGVAQIAPPSAQLGDDATTPSVSTTTTPSSSLTFFKKAGATEGISLGEVVVNVGLNLASSADVALAFSAVGSLGFVYPCGLGRRAYGAALLNGNVPDVLELKDFSVGVQYNCGELPESTPRFTASGSTTEGIVVGGGVVQPFALAVSVYSASEATGGKHRFAGIVSGSVKAGVGDNGQLGADVSFAFDTKVGRCRLTPS